MISIYVAASTDYYLGRAAGNSETMGMGGRNRVGYYEGAMDADPLARRGTWGGRYAETLGMGKGSEVIAEEFRALSFGHDPKDPKRALHSGMPSIEEQVAADKLHRMFEKKVDRLQSDYFKARNLALEGGLSPNETDFVLKAKAELELAKMELRGHSNSKAIREKGHDLAFSLPKTVSCHLVALLAEAESHPDPEVRRERKAQADAIERLFTESVNRVMEYIERDMPTSRPRNEKGERSYEPMEGLAWANFMHFDARPVDGKAPAPTGHIHCVLMNVARRHDGELNAVWTTYLAQNIKTLGARFRAEMSQGLMGMGYEVAPETQDKLLGYRLIGMEKAEADMMSDRMDEIRKNEEAGMGGKAARTSTREGKLDASEFDGADFLRENAARLAALGHDSQSVKGSMQGRIEKIAKLYERKNAKAWRAADAKRAKWEGSPETWPKDKAVPRKPSGPKPPDVDGSPGNIERWRERARKQAIDVINRERGEVPVTAKEIVEKCLEMDTAFTVRDVERAVCEAAQFVTLPAGMSVDEFCHRQTAAVLSDPDILEVQKENGPQGRDQTGLPIFTTRSQRAREVELYGEVFPRLMDARDRLHLSRSEAEAAISKWERTAKGGKGARLAPNQRSTAIDVLTNPSGFQIVQGFAGSGKTFMAECSFEILKKNGASLIAMAPTTAAALQLKTDIGASLAYTPESLAAAMDAAARNPKAEPLITKDTIIFLDESSMLDFKETHSLIKIVEGAGGKVIFSGDEKQLQAVGAGNIYKRLISLATRAMDDNAKEADASTEAGFAPADQPRLLTFLNKDFGDHDTIQRQARSVGRQIVAWAEMGETLRAFDAMDRRGMVVRHPTAGDKRDVYKDAASRRSDGAPTIDFPREASLLRRARDEHAAGRLDRKGLTAASRRFYAKLDELAKFHQQNLVVAERRVDVRGINELCRQALKAKGVLGSDDHEMTLPDGTKIKVAVGERIAFTEKATERDVNFRNADLATKGMIGTVVDIKPGKNGWPEIRMVLDGDDKNGRRLVHLDTREFSAIDHAYAMTVHRSQGQTADHVQYIGNKTSSANLFLVGASRFKKSCLVHVMENEIEAFKSSIAIEQRKLDATDRAAAEYNLFEEGDVAEYIAAAAETRRRFEEARIGMGRALSAEAKARDDRERGAAAARIAKRGMAARVVEGLAFCAHRLVRREDSREPAADDGLADLIRAAAARHGIGVEKTLGLGIARRSGEPGTTAGGGAADKTPSIMESINEIVKLARRGLGIDGPDGRPATRPNDPFGPPMGGLAEVADGGGAGGDGRPAAPGLLGRSQGLADKGGWMQALRARRLDGQGEDADRLLQAGAPDDLDAGDKGVGRGRGDDDLRRGDPAGAARGRQAETGGGALGMAGGKPGGGRSRSDWEWLGIRGDDVVARNLMSGQLEVWSKAALLRGGRADLVRAALDRFGILERREAPKAPRGMAEGRLVELGHSHFRGDETKRVLQHAVIERADGVRETVWGASLHAAIERAGAMEMDWINLDNSRKETRRVPVLATEPGADSIQGATVEWVKEASASIRANDGRTYILHGEQAAALRGMEGEGVEFGFIERELAMWDCGRAQDPNPLPWESRAAAAELVMARVVSGEADGALPLLGLDRGKAEALWPRGADDIVLWDHIEARARAWESLGWGEGDGRRFLGVELARDSGHAYLACGIGGKDGSVEDAGDRIVAVPLSALEGIRADGWLSMTAGPGGISVSRADPIIAAAEAGDATMVAKLLSEGADPGAADLKGRTATMLAAKAGKSDALALLLAAGADPEIADMDGMTPLIAAASRGHSKAAGSLIAAGADPMRSAGGHIDAESAAISGRHDKCADAIRAAAGKESRSKDGGRGV